MRDFRGNLQDYLSQIIWGEATDRRDKVYGILSLAKHASNLGLCEEKQNRRAGHGRTENRPKRWVPSAVDFNMPLARMFINVTKAII